MKGNPLTLTLLMGFHFVTIYVMFRLNDLLFY